MWSCLLSVTEIGETATVVVETVKFATVKLVLPFEDAKVVFPPYAAVIESDPTLNPFAVVAATLSVAVPLESAAVPRVVLPIENVTRAGGGRRGGTDRCR